MKLEDQVCNLEWAKQLEGLGVKQDSLFYHIVDGTTKMLLDHKSSTWGGRKLLNYSAFTVAELGELLPTQIKFDNQNIFLSIEKKSNLNDNKCSWLISYGNGNCLELLESFNSKNLTDALTEMLIYLIKNKLM